jgi:predicted outer membrane repeat protein
LVLTGSKSNITVIGGQMADVGSIELISQEEVIEAIVYVRPDGADGNNGSTWDQAVQTIQKAVDLANPGDEIWVVEGDYAISTTIEIAKPVKIYGGFAGDETTQDERHGESDAIVTAFFPGRCFHITANATIDRMTITSDADYAGGGIRSEGTSAQNISVTLRSCAIQGNTSDQGGGGISIAYGTIAISGCQLYNNTGRYGGAIASFYSTVYIADCEFGSNTTTGEDNGYGGAVYSYECPAVEITRSIFMANQGIWGGGVANYRSSVTLTSCVFNDNEARNTYGGGVCTLLGDVTITNCTFVGNSALEGGGAISNLDLDTSPGSSARITNCILWSDSSPEIHNRSSTPIVNYCDVQGGYPGDTNINSDPVLIKNVFLDPSSPCIDAGTNAAPSLPEFDLFGNPRIDIVGLIVDMGAAEYVYP